MSAPKIGSGITNKFMPEKALPYAAYVNFMDKYQNETDIFSGGGCEIFRILVEFDEYGQKVIREELVAFGGMNQDAYDFLQPYIIKSRTD